MALTIQDGKFPFQVPLTSFPPNNFIVTLMSLVAEELRNMKMAVFDGMIFVLQFTYSSCI